MKKEEREKEGEVFNTIKYIFHCNYSIKMLYCAALRCSNNSFRKNREKGTSFYSFPKDDNQKWIQNMKQLK